MNKIILTSVILMLAFSLGAQKKVIENPSFKGTTASYIKVLKVELSDTATAIDFRVHYTPNMWIRVPKETWIQDSKGGEKLYVKSAKGIIIDTEHFTPESGVNDYTLYFPPVGDDVEAIDYLENQWKIFGIGLGRGEKFSIFPEPLLGNWLRTDGSNEWVYGFHEDFVVYGSDIWKQVLISQNDGLYQVVLQKDGKREKLFVKQQDENLLIGANENSLESFSRELTQNADYAISNDEEFKLPVFKKDTAVYRGIIKGYHPEMGNTGMVYVNNVISGEQESFLVTITPEGTFNARFPMLYPQQVLVRMLNFYEGIFCEPGKTTFQMNDFSKYHDEGGPNLLFMGSTSLINQDLIAMKGIRFYNYQEMQEKILDMSPEEYKLYCMDIMNRELEAVDEHVKSNAVRKKALQMKKMQISFTAGRNILSYNMNRQSAYRVKHKVPRDQREIPLEREELSKEFYNFLDPDELNNPLSVVAGGDYYFLINRVKYADPLRPKSGAYVNSWESTAAELAKRGIELEAAEKELMEKLSKSENNEERQHLIKEDSVTYKAYREKYDEVLREIGMEMSDKRRDEALQEGLKEYFNLEAGLAMDVMKSQDKFHRMESIFEPLTELQKEQLKSEIQNEFIVSCLLEKSAGMEIKLAEKQEAYKNPSGFVVNDTPEVTEGDLFDTIMKKYKGKVVFVDFWATWCGPCRSGMERIKPLKEELKDKDLVFVYITNPSSPQKTWEMLIPDIHGEHYYLTQDEWNVMAARFKVSGIPHYVLVDKKGKVVQDKVYFASSNAELKTMFAGHLEQ